MLRIKQVSQPAFWDDEIVLFSSNNLTLQLYKYYFTVHNKYYNIFSIVHYHVILLS